MTAVSRGCAAAAAASGQSDPPSGCGIACAGVATAVAGRARSWAAMRGGSAPWRAGAVPVPPAAAAATASTSTGKAMRSNAMPSEPVRARCRPCVAVDGSAVAWEPGPQSMPTVREPCAPAGRQAGCIGAAGDGAAAPRCGITSCPAPTLWKSMSEDAACPDDAATCPRPLCGASPCSPARVVLGRAVPTGGWGGRSGRRKARENGDGGETSEPAGAASTAAGMIAVSGFAAETELCLPTVKAVAPSSGCRPPSYPGGDSSVTSRGGNRRGCCNRSARGDRTCRGGADAAAASEPLGPPSSREVGTSKVTPASPDGGGGSGGAVVVAAGGTGTLLSCRGIDGSAAGRVAFASGTALPAPTTGRVPGAAAGRTGGITVGCRSPLAPAAAAAVAAGTAWLPRLERPRLALVVVAMVGGRAASPDAARAGGAAVGGGGCASTPAAALPVPEELLGPRPIGTVAEAGRPVEGCPALARQSLQTVTSPRRLECA